jgi:MbtH protein
MSENDAEEVIYVVVINHEEQYSIWPNYKEIPKGWRSVDKSGSKQECLDYIKEVWVDMRPLSLRKAMEQSQGS